MIRQQLADTTRGEEGSIRKRIVGVGIVGFLLTLLPLALYLIRFHGPLSASELAFANFGAFIGGAAGPLLSFLALIALLMTIEVQLKELQETRAELRKSAEALDAQQFAMQKQLFDAAFFEQIRLLNDIVNAMQLKTSQGHELRGRACFVEFERKLRSLYDDNRVGGYDEAYAKAYKRFEAYLGHYFRTMYNLVRFIDERGAAEKLFYIRLVRAQLSDSELALLFYNGLSKNGARFKPLIEKYALLDTFNDEHLLSPDHKLQYSAGAYSTSTAWALLTRQA